MDVFLQESYECAEIPLSNGSSVTGNKLNPRVSSTVSGSAFLHSADRTSKGVPVLPSFSAVFFNKDQKRCQNSSPEAGTVFVFFLV